MSNQHTEVELTKHHQIQERGDSFPNEIDSVLNQITQTQSYELKTLINLLALRGDRISIRKVYERVNKFF